MIHFSKITLVPLEKTKLFFHKVFFSPFFLYNSEVYVWRLYYHSSIKKSFIKLHQEQAL
ncbi:hypothetical protein HMPREF9184_00401 [Streptococcus sp. oral taxon 058 str. F0407]|nr:hypothetical protein HMPREF9184_00401 [Streptococcus sp. oral taxon 058 str. F0407]